MKFKNQIILTIFLSMFIVLFVSMWLSRSNFSKTLLESKKANLIGQCDYVYNEVGLLNRKKLDAYAKTHAVRITFINEEGSPLYDSNADLSFMENHGMRDEISNARETGKGYALRKSNTTGKKMLYCALYYNDTNLFIRLSANVDEVYVWNSKFLSSLLPSLFSLFIFIIIITAFLIHFLNKPIEELIRISKQYSNGNFAARSTILQPKEFFTLSQTMNRMACDIDSQISDLKRLEHIRKDFVSNVSHELKTPITSIGGFASILANEKLPPATVLKFAAIIEKNTTQMKQIIDDLLMLASLEREKIEFPMEESFVVQIIQDAIEYISYKASQKGVIIKMDCPSDLKINGALNLLVQAVSNLISNAIIYSDEKSKIHIFVKKIDKDISIAVVDEGIGIPLCEQDRIFERFYCVDKARSKNHGGTGLGLAIVKHIVELHKGTLSLKSTPLKGSTFTLLLPQQND